MTASIEECLKRFAPGAGLFGTEVTCDDIEKQLCSALSTTATFGDGKTVTNIGDGKGFFSRICLIEPDWKNEGMGEDLPSKFVAKIPTVLAAIAAGESAEYKDNKEIMMQFAEMFINLDVGLKTMHNIECAVYDLIDKYQVRDKVKSPKIYYRNRFTDNEHGFILMEYKPNTKELPTHQNISPELLHEPLRCLAALEVLSLRITKEDAALLTNRTFKDVYRQILGPDKVAMFLGLAKGFGKGELDGLVDNLSGHITEIADIELYDSLSEKMDMRHVLCHGDLWSGNILWTENQGRYDIDSLIDYQNAHFGMAVTDICRLLSSTLSGEERRASSEQLLEIFYKYLLEEMNGEEAPYSLEKLKQSYKIFFPMGALGMIPLLVREQQMNGEKDDDNQLLLRKCQYLLEDILEFVENRPSFL